MPTSGVYFVLARAGDWPVKIGWSRNVAKRFADLQVASYDDLWLYGVDIQCRRAKEFEYHRRFAAQRIRGEWFRMSPELHDVLEERHAEWEQWKVSRTVYRWLPNGEPEYA